MFLEFRFARLIIPCLIHYCRVQRMTGYLTYSGSAIGVAFRVCLRAIEVPVSPEFPFAAISRTLTPFASVKSSRGLQLELTVGP